MSVLRPFHADDMFKFNNMQVPLATALALRNADLVVRNLDVWTETYDLAFYLQYLSTWPDLCYVQAAPSGRLMGYILGNAEGSNTEWHGHVTALTVAPEYRRLGLARTLTALLEFVSEAVYHAFFIDLFVRCQNSVAIEMYEGMGYSVWRRIREYYGSFGMGKGARDEEDAFDMRKPLSRDTGRRSVRANGRDMIVEQP